jgi:hypothetical protein
MRGVSADQSSAKPVLSDVEGFTDKSNICEVQSARVSAPPLNMV